MENIEALTDDLYDFFRDVDQHKGRVTPGRATNPVLKTRIDDWMSIRNHRLSRQDANEADANFLSYLKLSCLRDVTAARSQITYDFFVRDLAEQTQARNEMAKAFQTIIEQER